MKKLFFIIGILFLQAAAIAQPFEGKIIYENKYKSKLPNVTDEQLTAMMGSKQDYFVKAGNYKIATNGSYFQWQIYVNKDNKLYNKMTSSESLYWIDAAACWNSLVLFYPAGDRRDRVHDLLAPL